VLGVTSSVGQSWMGVERVEGVPSEASMPTLKTQTVTCGGRENKLSLILARGGCVSTQRGGGEGAAAPCFVGTALLSEKVRMHFSCVKWAPSCEIFDLRSVREEAIILAAPFQPSRAQPFGAIETMRPVAAGYIMASAAAALLVLVLLPGGAEGGGGAAGDGNKPCSGGGGGWGGWAAGAGAGVGVGASAAATCVEMRPRQPLERETATLDGPARLYALTAGLPSPTSAPQLELDLSLKHESYPADWHG